MSWSSCCWWAESGLLCGPLPAHAQSVRNATLSAPASRWTNCLPWCLECGLTSLKCQAANEFRVASLSGQAHVMIATALPAKAGAPVCNAQRSLSFSRLSSLVYVPKDIFGLTLQKGARKAQEVTVATVRACIVTKRTSYSTLAASPRALCSKLDTLQVASTANNAKQFVWPATCPRLCAVSVSVRLSGQLFGWRF